MTEADWLACDDPRSLIYSLPATPSVRKLRLLGCALCRLVWDQIEHPASRRCVDVSERFADRKARTKELRAAFLKAELAAHDPERPGGFHCLNFPFHAACVGRVPFTVPHLATIAKGFRDDDGENQDFSFFFTDGNLWLTSLLQTPWERLKPDTRRLGSLQATTIRCVFSFPFRPVDVSPSWLTSTVVTLADTLYADRAFDRLPMLADALQDAECEGGQVLDHCRGDGPHVRGCWVVDLVTGRG